MQYKGYNLYYILLLYVILYILYSFTCFYCQYYIVLHGYILYYHMTSHDRVLDYANS